MKSNSVAIKLIERFNPAWLSMSMKDAFFSVIHLLITLMRRLIFVILHIFLLKYCYITQNTIKTHQRFIFDVPQSFLHN